MTTVPNAGPGASIANATLQPASASTIGSTRIETIVSESPSAARHWLHRVGVTTLFIALGSPWENGYVESFNGKSETSASTANASTPCWKPRSSSRAGAGSTTRSAPTAPSATLPAPRERWRSLGRLEGPDTN